MATVGSLVVNLLGNTAPFRQSFSALPSFVSGITGQLAGLVGIAGGLGAIGTGVKLAADAEQMQVAFETMLGSAERAKSMLAELQTYAQQSPFSQIATQQNAQLLLNYGVAGDQILPTMRMLGDIAAGDEQKLEGLSRAFGQMSATGRLMGQDLNQMINAGFNPLNEISKRTGESMGALKARMEAGAVGVDEIRQAMIDATSEGGRFFNMGERQSRTLSGRFSTMKDEIDVTLRALGKQLIETFDLKGMVEGATSELARFRNWITTSGRDVLIVTAAIGGFVTMMLAVRTAIQAATIATAIWKAVSSPAGFAMVLAGIAGATIAVAALEEMFNASADRALTLQNNASGAAASIRDMAAAGGQLDKAFGAAGGAIGGGGPLAAAINQLRSIQAERAQGVSFNQGARLDVEEAGILKRIDELTTFREQANKAAEATNMLHERLAVLARQGAGDALGKDVIDQKVADVKKQIGLLSGASAKIRELEQEIQGVSKIDIEARKLSDAGALNEDVERYRKLAREAERVQELKGAKDSLVPKTPAEELKKRIQDLEGLRKRQLITEEQFARGMKLASNEYAEDQAKLTKEQDRKAADTPLVSVMRNSREEGAIIARALAAKNGGRAESLAERNAKAAEASAKLLKEIRDKEPEQTTEEILLDF